MTKKSKWKFKYLENKKSTFKMKQKAFFTIFKGLSVAKHCLWLESGPLRQWSIPSNIYIFKHRKTWNIRNIRNKSNVFKVNNKDTRIIYVASLVNFEHILHFIILLLLLNSNKCWLGLRIYSFRQSICF